MDGTFFPGLPSATSFRMVSPGLELTKGEEILFYRKLIDHLRKRGWLDKMFFYIADEPLISEYEGIKEQAKFFKDYAPEIKILLTESFNSELEGYIDIWCPDIPFIGDSVPFMPFFMRGRNMHLYPDWQVNLPPFIYKQRRAQGEETWLYTCTSAQAAEYPDLFIDSRSQQHRVIPWLMYRYGFTGFLYWNTINKYGKNPWINQYDFMANGDGNLLYPDYPEHPLIKDHRPIPSLRIKILREGFEDYEFLTLYAAAVGENAAKKSADSIVTSSLVWNHTTEDLIAQREKMGDALSKLLITH